MFTTSTKFETGQCMFSKRYLMQYLSKY